MIRPLRALSLFAAAHILCLSAIAQLEPSLLTRAAGGDATAMHLIARSSAADGKLVEAYAWFTLSTEYGVQTSEKAALADKLTPAQLEAATKRVGEIRSTILKGLAAPTPKPAAPVNVIKVSVQETPPPPTAPVKVEPVADDKAEAQKAEMARLASDLAAARRELDAAKRQSEDSIGKLEATLARANQERDALAGQVASLKTQQQAAEDALARLKAQPSLEGQVQSQKSQIAKLETDLAAARSEASAVKSASGQAGAKLEASLAKANQERDALAGQVASLEKEKQVAEESLAKFKAQPSLEGQVQSQKAQIAKLEASLTALRQERQSAEEARDQLRAELSSTRTKMEADLAGARSDATAAKKQADESATRLDAALAQAKAERESFNGEIAALKKDKQSAEAALSKMKAQPSLEGQVQSQKARIAKLESDLAAANAALSGAKEQSEESMLRLQAAVGDANKSRDALAAEVAALKKDKQRAEESLAQLKARPAPDAQVEAQKARISKLETDLAAARAEAASARTKADEAAAKLEVALAKPGDDRDARSKEIATLKQERLAAEQARDQLRVENSAARQKLEADLAAARNEARVAKAYAAKLETELANVRSGTPQFSEPAGNLRAAPTTPQVPAPVEMPAPRLPRIHSVSSGESLSSISQHYYGTPNRWEDIFNANRDVLDSPNQLSLGEKLRIP